MGTRWSHLHQQPGPTVHYHFQGVASGSTFAACTPTTKTHKWCFISKMGGLIALSARACRARPRSAQTWRSRPFPARNAITMHRIPVPIDASVVTDNGFRALMAPRVAFHAAISAVRTSCGPAPRSRRLGCALDATSTGWCWIADVKAVFANEATREKCCRPRLIFIGRRRERDELANPLSDWAHRFIPPRL